MDDSQDNDVTKSFHNPLESTVGMSGISLPALLTGVKGKAVVVARSERRLVAEHR